MAIEKKVKETALDLIREAKAKNEFVATQIRDELEELFGNKAPKSAQSIRNWAKTIGKKTEEVQKLSRDVLDEMNEDIEKKENYIKEDDNLIMQKETKDLDGNAVTKEYKVDVELISDMVFDYSRHGKNMSGPKIIDKYQIKPEVWKLLKSRLSIYKDSNACPDIILEHIEEKYGEKALDEKIEETSYRAIKSKYKEKYKETYEEMFKEEAKQALKTLSNIENFLEKIQDYLQDYEPVKLPERKATPSNSDTVDIAFSDLHIGKNNTNEILRRIADLRDYILEQPEDKVNLIFGGDLVEAIVEGGMHPGQVEYMDGPYGFDLLTAAADSLKDLLIEVYQGGKDVSFKGITGNHDRITQKNGDNPERTAGLVIFEMIRRSLEQTNIKVEYFREEINKFDTENFSYVVAHKLYKKQQRNAEKILFNQGIDPNKYSIVLHGHEHSINMKEGKNNTLIGIPALAGQGRYDKKLDLHSASGIIVIRKRNGLADILVKRFR